jgi:hypothetical protein
MAEIPQYMGKVYGELMMEMEEQRLAGERTTIRLLSFLGRG